MNDLSHYHYDSRDYGEDDYDYVKSKADEILESCDFIYIIGSRQRWNGTSNITYIIEPMSLTGIFHDFIEVSELVLNVYENSVKIDNIHNDGTNRYEFIPVCSNNATEKYLEGIISSYSTDCMDEYKEWLIEEENQHNKDKDNMIEYILSELIE
jgi:hypothetical protein